jgi:phospholipid/cholesterol/gamma-HCH transport system ATP-binding protein
MDADIVTKDLVVGYGEQAILSAVEVALPRRSITCLVGGSGSGKTTLFRTIVGLIPPLAGSVGLLGCDLSAATDADRDHTLRRVGMLFQNGALLNSMTVRENVAFPLLEHTDLPRPVVDALVRVRLQQLGVLHALDLYPSELSGGMRKRVGLARAMIHDPAILMCDEPSAGLDPVTSAGLDRVLLALKQTFELSIVVVTHELESIKRIADHVVMVGKRKQGAPGVLFDGPAQAFFASPSRESGRSSNGGRPEAPDPDDPRTKGPRAALTNLRAACETC